MHISVVENIEQLADYIERTSAAYRRSYKLMGRINTALNITKGIVISSAVIAVIPTVPILLALAPIPGVVIEIIQNKTGVAAKREKYKHLYVQYKQLLTQIRSRATEEPTVLISDIFNRAYEIQKQDNFSPPLERYMRIYALNGYVTEPPTTPAETNQDHPDTPPPDTPQPTQ